MVNSGESITEGPWPELPLEKWHETYKTLHRWTQIIGKIRLGLAPMVNHWWQVTLYPTARGLTTSPIPYGSGTFQIDFDFFNHEMLILTDTGDSRTIALRPCTVADFYDEMMVNLKSLGIRAVIWTKPVEVEERTPFEQDTGNSAYDPEYAYRCWKILANSARVMNQFRSAFMGKVSPVHFFWGAFDLAVTRFSGRRAPDHPGAPNVARYVMQEAYSHEVSSCGFWPGAGLGMPAFYAYAYPVPGGFGEYSVRPAAAYYHAELGEFLLPYDAVRTALAPDEILLAFLQSTYEAAATLAHWDRPALERKIIPSRKGIHDGAV